MRDVEVRTRVRTDQGVLLRDLLVAGAGVGWLFDFIVDADLRAGRLVEVLADHAVAERPIHALYLAHRNVPPKTRAFLDFAAHVDVRTPCARDWREAQNANLTEITFVV